jgi:hypothetical protein
MFVIADIDAMADKLSISDRIELKVALDKAGLLDTDRTALAKAPAPAPNPKLVRSVFAQLGIEHPHTMSVVAVDRALREHAISGRRALEIKSVIHAAGLLEE